MIDHKMLRDSIVEAFGTWRAVPLSLRCAYSKAGAETTDGYRSREIIRDAISRRGQLDESAMFLRWSPAAANVIQVKTDKNGMPETPVVETLDPGSERAPTVYSTLSTDSIEYRVLRLELRQHQHRKYVGNSLYVVERWYAWDHESRTVATSDCFVERRELVLKYV